MPDPAAPPRPDDDPPAIAYPHDPPLAPERGRGSSLKHFGQGVLMGSADVVPGVSGGTMALILGIYERFVDAVSRATTAPLALRKGWTETKAKLAEIEWGFLVPLGLGVLTAIAVGAKTIPPLMEAYPVGSRALFFGLVAASLAIPWRRVESAPWWGYVMAAAAGVLAFWLVGLPIAGASDPGLLRVFLSASVAICAMILPGVSGAFLLKAMGVYEPTLEALGALDVLYVGAFVLGAITGLALFSTLLDYLITKHHDLTMLTLVGVLAGSLRALWPWQGQIIEQGERVDTPSILLAPPGFAEALPIIGVAIVGFAIVAGLTWWGARQGDV